MHSSRMHTTHLLPVSPNMHCSWLVFLPGWVYLPKGCTCPGRGVPAQGEGGYLPRGCTCLGQYLPRYSLPCEQNS